MTWPLSQDYNEAIQNPATSLGDPDLKNGEPGLNAFGLPIPRSGNFADVYQFTDSRGKPWALKCFTRQVAGLRERYAAIDAHLRKASLPFTVRFRYLDEGIRVRKEWYPLLKMQWVEGFTLNEFLRDNLDKTAYLEALFLMWVRLCKRLREAKVAHGDLQHANVLLVPGASATKLELKLIDYDGMWVPALADMPSGEVGHANYQHPARAKQLTYGPAVDRFPHLVIACALRGLIVGGPEIWSHFDNGDNLLFRETDFQEPGQSTLIRTLWNLRDPVLCPLLGHLVLASHNPMESVPWLDRLLVSESTLAMNPEQQEFVAELLGFPIFESNSLPVELQQPTSPANMFAAIRAQAEETEQPDRTLPMVWLIAAGAVLIGLGLIIGPLLLMLFWRMSHSPPTAPAGATPMERPVESPGPPPPAPPEFEPLAMMPRAAEPEKPVVVRPKYAPLVQVWRVPGKAAPHCLDFTRDGRQVVLSPGDSKTITLLSAADGKAIGPPIENDDFIIRAIGCGIDGAALISGDDEGAVWDFGLRQSLRSVALADADLPTISISPDGKDAICISKIDGQFLRVGFDVGMTTGSWKITSEERIVSLRYGPDSKAAIGVDESFQFFIVDLVSNDQTSWPDSSRTARSVVMSPDKHLLLSFGKGKEILLWDIAQKKLLRKLAGHEGGVNEAVFASDGRILSVAADKTLRVWDVSSGEQIEKINLPEEAKGLKLSPDGRFAVTASATGPSAAVQMWRVRN